jgi:hypothetical protein
VRAERSKTIFEATKVMPESLPQQLENHRLAPYIDPVPPETSVERKWRIRFVFGGVVLLSIANLGVSAITCIFASLTYDLEKGSYEAQVFHSLRARYYEVSANLPVDIHEMKHGPKKGEPNWNAIKTYWEQALTEWYTTNKINNGQYKSLWKNFYVDVLQNSLSYPAFRDVLCDLRETRHYTADRRGFFEVMEELCIKATGKPLQRTSSDVLSDPNDTYDDPQPIPYMHQSCLAIE